jgi:hypothetical protein
MRRGSNVKIAGEKLFFEIALTLKCGTILEG